MYKIYCFKKRQITEIISLKKIYYYNFLLIILIFRDVVYYNSYKNYLYYNFYFVSYI